MSVTLSRQKGFSMVEVLLAMMLLVVVVTALSGYHRALAARYAALSQYRQLWHHAWNQSQISTLTLPPGWQVSRGRQHSPDVSASRSHLFPMGRQGALTRLHCPVSR